MDGPKFYLLGLFAMKLDPADVILTELPDGRTALEIKPGVIFNAASPPPFQFWAVGTVADSEEEARHKGRALLEQNWPVRDGWVHHHVHVNSVSRATLLEVAAKATGDQVGGADGLPDYVM